MKPSDMSPRQKRIVPVLIYPAQYKQALETNRRRSAGRLPTVDSIYKALRARGASFGEVVIIILRKDRTWDLASNAITVGSGDHCAHYAYPERTAGHIKNNSPSPCLTTASRELRARLVANIATKALEEP